MTTKMAARLERMGEERYKGLTKDGRWTGEVRVPPVHEAIEKVRRIPRRRDGKPRKVFVQSMADILHDDVPLSWLARVIVEMGKQSHVRWQMLTKRAHRWPKVAEAVCNARSVYGERWSWPSNVWVGVSVENQQAADERIPHLLKVPAAVRFLSCEPLLGPVDLESLEISMDGLPGCLNALTGVWWPACGDADEERRERRWWAHGTRVEPGREEPTDGVSWVIAGCESGPGARPMHPGWARSLRDQCAEAGVAFHFKQWGQHAPAERPIGDGWVAYTDGGEP